VRRVPGEDAWELAFPPSVLRRNEDLEEVRAMLDAGEIDIAVDELRWLLSGCSDLLEAHRLLGEIALADDDLRLAQAHFGYAYEMGLEAVRQASDFTGRLPYARPANQAFLEAGKGLAFALTRLGNSEAAGRIVRQLLDFDPSDPLGLEQEMRNEGSEMKGEA
jgi:tetratricopeptide (TPR) repeat protein